MILNVEFRPAVAGSRMRGRFFPAVAAPTPVGVETRHRMGGPDAGTGWRRAHARLRVNFGF